MDAANGEVALRPQLRKICLLFLVSAIVFFPMIMNPVAFELFDDTKTDAESVAFIEEHWLTIRLLFAGMGVSELGLGAAFLLWGRRVATMCSAGLRRYRTDGTLAEAVCDRSLSTA